MKVEKKKLKRAKQEEIVAEANETITSDKKVKMSQSGDSKMARGFGDTDHFSVAEKEKDILQKQKDELIYLAERFNYSTTPSRVEPYTVKEFKALKEQLLKGRNNS